VVDVLVYEAVRARADADDLVLDVGTKDGRRLTGIDARTVAVDIELRDDRAPGPAYACADGRRLPFPDDSFDYVISNQVLEHVPFKRQMIREMARVVASDGEVHVSVLNRLTPSKPHFVPRYVSFLPRRLGTVLAPRLLSARGERYYREQLFHVSPPRLRRLLAAQFDSVRYSKLSIYENQDGVTSTLAGEAFVVLLPLVSLLCRAGPVRWLYEMAWPYTAYECRETTATA
jgi:ubiquinone/menaquinone biosynthesis C-methylase UbiE